MYIYKAARQSMLYGLVEGGGWFLGNDDVSMHACGATGPVLYIPVELAWFTSYGFFKENMLIFTIIIKACMQGKVYTRSVCYSSTPKVATGAPGNIP